MSSPAFAPSHSTGPRTESGKAASSQNALKHGLASGTLFIEGEDPAEFDALHESLRAEHTPGTATETLLTRDMATLHWLADRAIRLQALALATDNLPYLATLLRYQISNHRAFHKSLATLLSLRKQTVQPTREFVSQKAEQPPKPQPDRFAADFTELVEGPFTPETQEQFAQKYGLRKKEQPATPGRLPRNQR